MLFSIKDEFENASLNSNVRYIFFSYVNDVARRVGEMTASSKSVVDLFAMDIELYRQKLRDNCEKLLFLDPLNYGKKTLELLWRKVYYDTVSAAKKLHETDNDNSSYLFTHLVCGIGHFHHLISRIQLEMNVQHKELDYIAAHIDDEFNEKNDSLPVTDIELQFGRSILYSCLIYLGDLSRYQAEIFMTFDSSIAARYYLQAAHIDLASGMPYNQLANLYLDKNYNIDSVCYYIHCLNCTTPFEGAMDNLEKIFEKNSQFIDSTNDTESLTQSEHIQNTIVNFLSLIDLWYFEKNDTNISERCSMIIQGLKVSMDFDQTQMPDPNKSYSEYIQTVEEESTCPSYLHPNLILKIVQICLFTIQKLTETDETKAFACKAFTLALLSQLVQRLVKNLESIGLKNPASEYRSRTATSIKESETDVIIEEVVDPPLTETKLPIELPANGKDYSDEETDRDIENIVEIDKAVNGDVKNNAKKVMSKRRRRRRILSSGSSDESVAEIDNSDVETFESCSEEEQSESDSLLTDEDSQNDSEEDTDKENDEKINSDVFQESVKLSEPQTTENCTETDINKNKKEGSNSNNVTNKTSEEKLKMFLLGDNIMSSVKLLQDWAMSEKDLILSCGDSGESLFQSVVDLLNIFTHNFTLKRADEDNDDCNFLKYARSIVEKVKLEYKMTPLPEDINLRGTNICKFDKDAAEWQFLDRCKPSVYEESIIRILNFIDFGNFIANIVPRIRFNRTMKIFFIKNVNAPTLSMKINHKKSKEWHNSKKQHVSYSLLLIVSEFMENRCILLGVQLPATTFYICAIKSCYPSEAFHILAYTNI